MVIFTRCDHCFTSHIEAHTTGTPVVYMPVLAPYNVFIQIQGLEFKHMYGSSVSPILREITSMGIHLDIKRYIYSYQTI